MASEEEKADEAAAKQLEAQHGSNGIYQAAREDNLPALRHFLRVAPGRVDAQDWGSWTPLHWAAGTGRVAAAELLISKGAAVDAKKIDGRTPLHYAAIFGHVAAAEFLLAKGAAVDATDRDGKTPLDLAREKGNTEMVQFLLNWPAKKPSAEHGKTPRDLSSKGKSEKEPLSTAADETSKAGKKAQQTPGFAFSSPRRQTSKEDAAPHAAGSGAVAVKHQRSTFSSCESFSENMASEEEKADEAAAKRYGILGSAVAILGAAMDGDVPALRHFLRVAPGGVREKDSTGCTPLHWAAAEGHVAAAELLISKGAAVDAKTDFGQTPLHLAAYKGQVEVAELLLSKGAAVDAKDDRGKTPLDVAKEEHETKMEQLLLNPPAKKPSADDGKTPRDLSSKGKSEKEPLPTAADKTSEADKKAQQTPVFPFSSPRRQTSKEEPSGEIQDPSSPAGSGAAAAKHQREASKEEAGVHPKEVEALSSKDEAAAAAEECNSPVHRAEAAAASKCNGNIHRAASVGSLPALRHFLRRNPERVRKKDRVGWTLLHDAAANGHIEAAELLLSKGAVVDARESNGQTPLHFAAFCGRGAAAELLLSKGAALNAKSKYGKTPLDLATERGKTEMVQFLRNPSAAASKAESSVKLEPGHGARLAMFSARFNEKNKETETKFRAVHQLLVDNQYEVLMVEAGEGESYGVLTARYLSRLKREKGVMLAVCTSDYGEMTDSPFCTYYELKSAVEYKIDVLPLQVEDEWQPNPPCGKGHLDEHKDALGFIDLVFTPSLVRLDCRGKSVEEIAGRIAAKLRKPR